MSENSIEVLVLFGWIPILAIGKAIAMVVEAAAYKKAVNTLGKLEDGEEDKA